MKNIFVILSLLISVGCATKVTIPLDPEPIKNSKSTLIIFHEQGFTDEFNIFIDNKPVGIVTSDKPFKIGLEPGAHSIYTKVPMNVIDRVTNFNIKDGEVQYMRIWLDLGMWASSIRIDPTFKRDEYNTRVTSDKLKKLKETNTGFEVE